MITLNWGDMENWATQRARIVSEFTISNIEITEMCGNFAVVKAALDVTIEALKRAGFRVAVDGWTVRLS